MKPYLGLKIALKGANTAPQLILQEGRVNNTIEYFIQQSIFTEAFLMLVMGVNLTPNRCDGFFIPALLH